MISSILGPRVGWSCIWVKRFEVVISMTACWISWSFAEGLTELFSQFMSGHVNPNQHRWSGDSWLNT